MRFLTVKTMKIIEIGSTDKIDKDTFNIFYRQNSQKKNPLVPAAHINGVYYLLSNFYADSKELVLLEDIKCFSDALKAVIEIGGEDYNLVDLSNIYYLIKKLDLNKNDYSVFRKNNIVNKEQFDILDRIFLLSDNFKRYIVDKDISLKVLSIVLKFNADIVKKIEEYVLKNYPSVSSFRILINNIYDYKDEIDFENNLEDEIERLKFKYNRKRYEFEKIIEDILKIENGITVENKNNYETCRFNVNFEISSFEDFMAKLQILHNSSGKIKAAFDILKENDLC